MNPFAAHGIEYLSPSSINGFCASPALWVLERLLKRKSPVGAAAHRGTAAEAGIVKGLVTPELSLEYCVEVANAKFRELTALSRDPNKAKEGAAVPGIVKQGLEALRPYGIPAKTQGRIEHRFEGLAVPVMGFYDLFYEDRGIILDIKTQLRLASEIKTSHARQVALYKTAISDNIDAQVAYLSDKKSAIYRLENHREHARALHRIAMAIQRFLSVSSDPGELAAMVAPDTDHYFFNDPLTRQAAFEVFGV